VSVISDTQRAELIEHCARRHAARVTSRSWDQLSAVARVVCRANVTEVVDDVLDYYEQLVTSRPAPGWTRRATGAGAA
jgi:hypothetical protein